MDSERGGREQKVGVLCSTKREEHLHIIEMSIIIIVYLREKENKKKREIIRHQLIELVKVLLLNYAMLLLYSSIQLSFLGFHAEPLIQFHEAKKVEY